MAKFIYLNILVSLSLFLSVAGWPTTLASDYPDDDYPDDDYLVEDYYEANEGVYSSPSHREGQCEKGKFRFNWMKDESSFVCPLANVSRIFTNRHGCKQHNKMATPRIIGGFMVEPGEFPSYVQLVFLNASNFIFNCGGTLMHGRYILTAAHCIMGAKVGGFAFAGSILSYAGHRATIRRGCISTKYDASSVGPSPHDWAVLELAANYNLTADVQPSCVNWNYKLKKDIKCVAVGYGLTENHQPSRMLKAAVMKRHEPVGADQAGVIWATKFEGQNGAGLPCSGDSGGPLYCYENCSGRPKVRLVGVTSHGVSDNPSDIECRKTYALSLVDTVSLLEVVPPVINYLMSTFPKGTSHRLGPPGRVDDRADEFICREFKPLRWPL